MKNLLWVVITTLTIVCPGRAQEAGCFKSQQNGAIELVSAVDLSKYNVFFVGEFHDVENVPEIKLALIKYLEKNHGITDVFMEVSVSAAWLYNRYLETGDTSFFIKPALVYSQTARYRDFWKQLYQYNQALQHKMIIHGIDFERIEFIKVLKLLMPPDKVKPEEIAATLDLIGTASLDDKALLYTDKFKKQNDIYEKVKKDIADKIKVYEQFFGVNFEEVKSIVFNENTYLEFGQRDKAMYRNILQAVENEHIRGFVSFNGINHGDRGEIGSLSNLLSRTQSFKNGFVDIAMMCESCAGYAGKKVGKQFKGPHTYETDLGLMGNLYNKYFDVDCNYTLIRTDSIGYSKAKTFSDFIILIRGK